MNLLNRYMIDLRERPFFLQKAIIIKMTTDRCIQGGKCGFSEVI